MTEEQYKAVLELYFAYEEAFTSLPTAIQSKFFKQLGERPVADQESFLLRINSFQAL